MGEAAALPPEDPIRREVEARIAASGGWAEEEWLDLLEFDDRVRIELLRIHLPEGLEQNLLNIPDGIMPTKSRRIRLPWQACAAALLIFAASAVLVWLVGGRGDARMKSLEILAILALKDHVGDAHLAFETDNGEALERFLTGAVPFEVQVPDLGPLVKLKGGRRCVLGLHPVVYSLWEGPGGRLTLYQFQTEKFDLPAPLDKTLVQIEEPLTENQRFGALIWQSGKAGYVLVADEAGTLEDLFPDIQNFLKTKAH